MIKLLVSVFALAWVNVATAQTAIKQVGPSAEGNNNGQILSLSLLGETLNANDFISLKKWRKEGASTKLNYQIDFSSFKKLKPNDVSFKMSLLRDGTKVWKKTWKHVEKATSIDLADVVATAEEGDLLIIEVSGLPLKSTGKVRTIVVKK